MPLYGWNGSVNGMGGLMGSLTPSRGPQQSSLINTASNYNFPMTSGLLQSLYQTSQPYSGPDYTQTALQLAGNPHAGPYAQVAPPSGIGVPGPGTPGSTGSGGGSTATNVLGAALGLLNNPLVASGVKGLLGDLGIGAGASAIPEAGASSADMLAAYGGGTSAIPEAGASDAAMAGAYGAPAADTVSTVTPTASYLGAAAAPAAADTVSTVTPTASYIGADAGAADAGTAGTLGTLGSALAGLGIIGGIAAYGASTPPYTLSQPYYDRQNALFNQTIAGGIQDPNFVSNYDELTNGGITPQQANSEGLLGTLSPAQSAELSGLWQQYLASRGITGQPPSGPLGQNSRGNGSFNAPKHTSAA